MSTAADRRKERRRRERYSESEAGPSRPRSREREQGGEGNDRKRKRGSESRSLKGRERPVLQSVLSQLNPAEEPKRSRKPEVANTKFENGEDFVAFTHSSEDEDEDARKAVREWDKGKGKAADQDREVTSSGTNLKHKHNLVFDDDELVQQRRESAYRRAPWVTAVDWESCKNVPEMLHREVEAFVNYISPTPVEDEVRSLVVDLVSKAVSLAFPDAKVLPFGSFGTKLYLPLGDIDLVIQSESMAYSDKVTVLHALANTLKRAKITTKVTIIAKAKVPIVKFVTTYGRLSVDISVNQGNGVVAGEIVNGFLKDMHGGGMALKSLVMITKAFLSQRSMNEVYTGGLGSYSIVCLAVSFLQMHPKIRKGEIDAAKNLGVLVMEFFELYGCYFNYEEVGISVRDGGSYYSKQNRGWFDYYKRNLLSIEDPTDPSNDISKGSYAVQKVRTTFAGAHGILTATAYLRAGMMRSQQNGQYFDMRSFYNSEDASILASILGITQETVNHRRLVQEVYDNRTLHRLLGVEPRKRISDPKFASQSEFRRSINFQAESSTASNGRSKVSSYSAQAVEEVFEEADMELSSDSEKHTPPSSRAKEKRREPSEEEGRYGIGSRDQRPKKRRKVGTRADAHTVFMTDEEDDEDGVIAHTITDEESDSEHDEYASDGGVEGEQGTKTAEQDRRRSYWLSKGVGPGAVDDDDSN